MSLINRMEDEVKQATLARDPTRRDALRLLLASLRSAEKELQRPLSDEEELQVLQRERKRRIEAAEAFRTGGREEQAQGEEQELAVLQEFMPEPLSEDELEEIVDDRARLGHVHVVAGDRQPVPAQQDRALEPVPERVEHAVADRGQLGRDVVGNIESLLHLLHTFSVGRAAEGRARPASP